MVFELPYRFRIPDILFYEEVAESHGHLLSLGLEIGELSSVTMMQASELINRYRRPSRNDCFALALAMQEACPLLTGDAALRTAAFTEGVEVKGTIWLVEQMVNFNLIDKQQAVSAYQLMKTAGRRLPWTDAFKRLEEK
ncbi:PIN domain-containing protein [Allohahella marinimesophila]|uniref:Nucleic acid-binding protein n=1 Tax=Allohahella marinimesophila TaxID=1054972 RepID=A0ABP7P9X5_9GAMM